MNLSRRDKTVIAAVLAGVLAVAAGLFIFLQLSRDRLIPSSLTAEEVDRVVVAHTRWDGSAPSETSTAGLTDPEEIRQVLLSLRNMEIDAINMPMGGERRLTVSFSSAGRELGTVTVDSNGVCASSFLGPGNHVARSGFDALFAETWAPE